MPGATVKNHVLTPQSPPAPPITQPDQPPCHSTAGPSTEDPPPRRSMSAILFSVASRKRLACDSRRCALPPMFAARVEATLYLMGVMVAKMLIVMAGQHRADVVNLPRALFTFLTTTGEPYEETCRCSART